MANGRIQCLLIASRSGHVVYERFYDTFKDQEKAAIRESIDQTAGDRNTPEDSELVGRFRNGYILVIPSGELLFAALGTGEYNPLALGLVLRPIIDTLKDITKTQILTDAALFQNYAPTILVIDEVVKEGVVEYMDKASIMKAIALKMPTYATDSQEKSGISQGLKSLMSQKYSGTPKA